MKSFVRVLFKSTQKDLVPKVSQYMNRQIKHLRTNYTEKSFHCLQKQ